MLIGISSDIHVGNPRQFSKFVDLGITDRCITTLNAVEEMAKVSEKLDAFIIAGDLFENPRRSTVEVNNLTKDALSKFKCPLYILPGNHDRVGVDKLHCATTLYHEPRSNRYVFSGVKDYRLGDVRLYGIPYLLSPNDVNGAIGNKIPVHKKVNILVLHGWWRGLKTASGYKFTDPHIDLKRVKGFDLVIVGHIHVPGVHTSMNNTQVLIPGPPLQHNFGEQDNDCGYWTYNTSTRKIKQVPLSYPRFITENVGSDSRVKVRSDGNYYRFIYSAGVVPPTELYSAGNVRVVREKQEADVDTITSSTFDIKDFIKQYVRTNSKKKDRKRLTQLGRRAWDEYSSPVLSNRQVRLVRIQGKDFFSYKSFNIQVKDRGLVAVTGFDRVGEDSNGAGKTALFIESIMFALFHKTMRGVSPPKAIRDGSKLCWVEVEFTVGDTTHTIRRHQKLSGSRIAIDGKDYSTREGSSRVGEIIPINEELLQYLCVFTPRLDYCAAMGVASQREILDSIIGIKGFEEAGDTVKRELTRLEGVLDRSVNAKIDANSGKRSALEGELKQNEKQARRQRDQAAQLKVDMESNLAKQLAVAKGMEDNDKRVATLLSRVEDYHAVDKTAHRLESEKRDAELKLNKGLELWSEFESTGSSKCRICGQKLKGKSWDQHKESHEVVISALSETIQRLEEELSSSIKRRAKKRKFAEEKQEIEAQHWSSNRKLEDLKEKYSYMLGQVQQPQAYVEIVNRCKERIAKIKAKQVKLKKKRVVLEQQIADLEFWMTGFGPDGIQRVIVEQFSKTITTRMYPYLQRLGNSKMGAELSSLEQLASGKQKNKLNFGYSRHGSGMKDTKSASAGERQRLNFAFSLALADFLFEERGISANLGIYDECMERVSVAGQLAMVQLLEERIQSGMWDSCYVITHDKEVANLFDSAVHVECNIKGVSTIEEN